MNRLILFAIFIYGIATEAQNLPQVSSGSLERLENFESKYVFARNVDVWLPSNYTPNNRYKVIYMHDGQMLFDANTTWNKQEWKVDETISSLIEKGKIEPCIVVAIFNNNEYRHRDYFPQKVFNKLPIKLQNEIFKDGIGEKTGADNYLKFIVEELKPYIDKEYSTDSQMASTFIAGSSMGGLISMYAICEYPEVFGGAACISTHWPGNIKFDDDQIPMGFLNYLKENLPDKNTHKIYFDFGTETLDQYYEVHQKKIDKLMGEKGWTKKQWTTLKFEGENHSEDSWSKRFNIPIEFLMSK